jgi:hypothetical protein
MFYESETRKIKAVYDCYFGLSIQERCDQTPLLLVKTKYSEFNITKLICV